MAHRRLHIRQHRRVFLACEGRSEQGYANWLNRLAHGAGIHVAIRAARLQGGDPLDLVESAESKLASIERQRGRYRYRGLLLDGDLTGINPARDAEALGLARRCRIRLIWQEPVHEAFILRHFEGFESYRPPDKAAAERQLRGVWPDYQKGMDATGYETRLGLAHLERVRAVEPAFDDFLASVGWGLQSG